MSFKVVIPARYGSTRFPGKVLVDIAGRPMIAHVYQKAIESGAEEVIVATDENRVAEAAQGFGAKVCMTSAEHQSGTDRIAEVARQLNWSDDTVIVNVQGDEPLIPSENIAQVANNLQQSQAPMATLVTEFDSPEQMQSPDTVKVVVDNDGYAIYFSRSIIPYDRDGAGDFPYMRHVGIYAYTAAYLQAFSQWEPAAIENVEKLEQLRALAYGAKVHIGIACKKPHHGVDSQADLDDLLPYFTAP